MPVDSLWILSYSHWIIDMHWLLRIRLTIMKLCFRRFILFFSLLCYWFLAFAFETRIESVGISMHNSKWCSRRRAAPRLFTTKFNIYHGDMQCFSNSWNERILEWYGFLLLRFRLCKASAKPLTSPFVFPLKLKNMCRCTRHTFSFDLSYTYICLCIYKHVSIPALCMLSTSVEIFLAFDTEQWIQRRKNKT